MTNHSNREYSIKSFSSVSILIVGLIMVVVSLYDRQWYDEDKIIRNDVKSYYSYLPATFIYRDISLSFLEANEDLEKMMWPVRINENEFLIVTTSGLSFLYSPFFLLGHLYASISEFEPDGYSLPYRLALQFASIFYLLLGLVFMRKTLRMFFHDATVAITIISVALGTNLFYYSVYEPGMPHVYCFSLISMIVYQSIKWHKNNSWQNSAILGLLFGIVTLIRPTNFLVVFFFVLWGIKSWGDFSARFNLLFRRSDLILIMILLFMVVWFPQLLYWKTMTGNWIFYSYGTKDAGFYFLNPQIFNILISYKKGWFVYTPIMLIAFIGIFLLIRKLKLAFWSISIYIIVTIYILSSWWSWWYGGGFGLRAFVDTYAVMAIPLAAVLETARKFKFVKIFIISLIGLLALYNLFQTRQYNNMAIHWWWMNKNAYWETFLKQKPTKKYWELITYPDYPNARKGIYETITQKERVYRYRVRKLRNAYEANIREDSLLMNRFEEMSGGSNVALDTIVSTYARDNLNEYIYIRHKAQIDSIAEHINQLTLPENFIMQRISFDGLSKDSVRILKAIEYYKLGEPD